MKKITSLILAMAMVFSLSAQVFALNYICLFDYLFISS